MSDRTEASADDFAFDDDDFAAILGDDDGDAALEAEDATPADADPVAESPESPADAEEPAVAAASAEEAASSGPSDAPAEPPADTQPLTTQGFTPPTGDPFTFTVDGKQVAVDGAVVAGDYVVIPRTAWDRQIRPNHLADRSVWRQKEQAYQQEIAQRDASLNQEVATARAIMARVAELNQGGPEAWAKWLDQFHVNAPLLEAQARATVMEQQLQRSQQAEQARQMQAQAEALVPRLKAHLEQTVEQWLARDEYKVLGPEAQTLKDALWSDDAERLFFTAERDMPEAGLRAGEVGFRYDLFQHLLDRHAVIAQRFAAQTRQVTQAAKLNAAAVAPPKPAKPAPKTVPSRDPATGQFTATKPAHWKDQLLEEDWSDIFEE